MSDLLVNSIYSILTSNSPLFRTFVIEKKGHIEIRSGLGRTLKPEWSIRGLIRCSQSR